VEKVCPLIWGREAFWRLYAEICSIFRLIATSTVSTGATVGPTAYDCPIANHGCEVSLSELRYRSIKGRGEGPRTYRASLRAHAHARVFCEVLARTVSVASPLSTGPFCGAINSVALPYAFLAP
jgi:hypothetical protein